MAQRAQRYRRACASRSPARLPLRVFGQHRRSVRTMKRWVLSLVMCCCACAGARPEPSERVTAADSGWYASARAAHALADRAHDPAAKSGARRVQRLRRDRVAPRPLRPARSSSRSISSTAARVRAARTGLEAVAATRPMSPPAHDPRRPNPGSEWRSTGRRAQLSSGCFGRARIAL